MATVELWIQIENRACDVSPDQIDEILGRPSVDRTDGKQGAAAEVTDDPGPDQPHWVSVWEPWHTAGPGRRQRGLVRLQHGSTSDPLGHRRLTPKQRCDSGDGLIGPSCDAEHGTFNYQCGITGH
jgi:hypothetical protein